MSRNNELGPICRAALRNKTGAILIALQIAFTMTVVVNSFYMIDERLGLVERPSGLVEDELFHLQTIGFGTDFNAQAAVEDDLTMLRNTPGVTGAVQMNAIPLEGSGWSSGLRVEAGEDTQSWSSAVYMVDEYALDTLGVNLLAGRNFMPTEVQWRMPNSPGWPDVVMLTQALATAMFPELLPAEIVGRTVFISNDRPMEVIGVLEKLQSPWSGWGSVEHSMLVPQKLATTGARYMIRADASERDAMMPRVEELLATANTQRILRDLRSMTETRERSYALDSGIAQLLVAVMVVLLVITAVGVLGLASFSVRRRTKQIGTRRALGATQGDILRYFLVENLFITAAGVVLGAFMTIGLNVMLVEAMSFPKIDWVSVPVGMLALLAIGQLAVLGPARRACTVSPALATRTV